MKKLLLLFILFPALCFAASPSWVVTINTLSGTVIDTSNRLNYKSISAATTFTFSGAPTAGSWFSLQVHNSDTDFAFKITIPTSHSVARNKNVTSATAFPNLVSSNGDTFLTWYYDGTTYFLFGDSTETLIDSGQWTTLLGHDAGLSATGADYSVFLGFEAGLHSPSPGQAVAIGYQAGQNPGNYAGTFVGYQAGKAGGGVSAVGIGYGALQSADASGSGNVAIGVHCAESASTISGTTAIGYHTLNGGSANSSNAIVIGDHAADSASIAASNCIFLGPYSGISRNNTLWIDGTGTSMGGTKPMIYGEFDNRKFTINGDGLFGRSSTNDAAVASAALEVRSTSQGLLLPRMTKTQRNAISSPATGLAIFQTDNTPGLRVYNGTNWMKFTEATD